MKTHHLWNGVPRCRLQTEVDPDSPSQIVEMPENWDIDAATALLQFCPDHLSDKAVIKADILAENWLNPLCHQDNNAIVRDWEKLLLHRNACPNESIWKGMSDAKLEITINLASFASSDGFNVDLYRHTLEITTHTIRTLFYQKKDTLNEELPLFNHTVHAVPLQNNSLNLSQQPIIGTIYLSNLDACLAQLGYDYDTPEGRDIACCLACFATLSTHVRCGSDFLPLLPDWNALPEIKEAAKELWALASEEPPNLNPRINTSFSYPNHIADLFLGVETCGFYPNFSPLNANGHLKLSTISRLINHGYSLETAIADLLMGETVLKFPSIESQYSMHQALVGFVTHMPPKPNFITNPLTSRAILPRGVKKPLPPRRKGITQKSSIAGRSLLLRTNEYEDGSLGELSITPTKESTMVKGLLESLSQAVTIGLQYGVPLKEYVDTFAYSHFGTAGTVEGDPNASYATSVLDYSFRLLSDIYLKLYLPDAPQTIHNKDNLSPMLPLDLSYNEDIETTKPLTPKKRSLKLVS